MFLKQPLALPGLVLITNTHLCLFLPSTEHKMSTRELNSFVILIIFLVCFCLDRIYLIYFKYTSGKVCAEWKSLIFSLKYVLYFCISNVKQHVQTYRYFDEKTFVEEIKISQHSIADRTILKCSNPHILFYVYCLLSTGLSFSLFFSSCNTPQTFFKSCSLW